MDHQQGIQHLQIYTIGKIYLMIEFISTNQFKFMPKKKLSEHFLMWIVPAHLFLILSIFLGNEPSWLMVLVFWIVIGPIGVGVGYHRLFCHSAFKTNLFYACILNFFGFLSGQGSVISWSAAHLFHHDHSDSNQDIHSPGLDGFWYAFLGWYIFESPKLAGLSLRRLDLSLLKSPIHRFLYRHYYKAYWGVILLLLALGLYGTVLSLIYAGLIFFYEVNIIDSICHCRKMGYRNYDTHDNSVNNWFLGLVTWGVGFHNNHHRFPKSWLFQKHWYEIDLGGYIVYLIKKNEMSELETQVNRKNNF